MRKRLELAFVPFLQHLLSPLLDMYLREDFLDLSLSATNLFCEHPLRSVRKTCSVPLACTWLYVGPFSLSILPWWTYMLVFYLSSESMVLLYISHYLVTMWLHLLGKFKKSCDFADYLVIFWYCWELCSFQIFTSLSGSWKSSTFFLKVR